MARIPKSIIKLGKESYKHAVKDDPKSSFNVDDVEYKRDKDGFIILEHISELPVKNDTDLVTDLSELEKRLDLFREEQLKKEPEKPVVFEQSKTKAPATLGKKDRKKLLKKIFNNADNYAAYTDEHSDNDSDDPEVKKDTLDTTYGQRYSPMVSMIHNIIGEYDDLADEIRADLASRTNMKTMYRSSQIANLISVKNSKLSAIKELTAIAKTITDLEYKKEKDQVKAEEGDNNKAVIALTTKFLRGGFDNIDDFADDPIPKKSPKNKNKNKKKKAQPDTEESDETFSIPKKKKKARKGYISMDHIDKIAEKLEDDDEADDSDLANALGKALLKHKDEIEFTPYEKHINMEGKYTLAVAADADKPSSNWKFIALDKDGKEIKGFKDKYGELIPKKSDCHMSFDTSKLRVTDKNTSITYKLLLK